MSIDSNSMCPGGSGKKIRDCGCDNLTDIQTIQKMFQGQQFAAALSFINSKLEKTPGRACLLAAKCDVLFAKQMKDYAEGKLESMQLWRESATEFYSLYPENPLALAWKSLICAMDGDVENGYDFLEQTFVQRYPEMNPSGLLSSLSLLYRQCLESGSIAAALFLLHIRATFLSQLEMQREYEDVHRLQLRILSDSSIPLPLRQSYSFFKTNSRGALTANFTAAQQLFVNFHWLEAAQAFEKIANEDPTELNAAFNSAIVYMNRDKTAEASQILKLYAQREPEINRKVDAYTTSLLLTPSPLQDNMALYDFQYNVSDQDKLKELLLSNSQIISQNVPAENFDGPPPLFIGAILDQPKQTSWNDSLTFEDIPLVLGSVALWGKRTDREAILEFSSILECDKAEIYAMVKETFGDCLSSEPQEVTIDAPSVTIDSFARQQAFPENTPDDKIRELQSAHFNDLLLNCWPELQLGVLGTSLRKAAADVNKQPMARAVIKVVEYLLGESNSLLDFPALYKELGLEPLPTLEVESSNLPALPPTLYGAIDVTKLTDNDLAMLYARYNPYGVDDTMHKLAQEIVNRDSLSVDIRKTAYVKLCVSGNGATIIPENVEKGKQFCKANNISDSYFDMMELQSMFISGKMDSLEKKMHQVYLDHKDEPQTMRALMAFVQQVQQLTEMLAQGQNPVEAANSIKQSMASEPLNKPAQMPGLWTPDSPAPAPQPAPKEEKKSSIWLPD